MGNYTQRERDKMPASALGGPGRTFSDLDAAPRPLKQWNEGAIEPMDIAAPAALGTLPA
jgi:hypothetical protein